MVIIAIIGSAGRDNLQTYSAELFEKMVEAAKYMMRNLTDITLVSGGAALSDHVAVQLYLDNFVSKLVLHLPCEWNQTQYLDTGVQDWRVNPGKTSNYYHSKFSSILGRNTLKEIALAIDKGAKVNIHKGFHVRNTYVARCDYMIAFTWSDSNIPVGGGTLDTWNKCTSVKYHVNLRFL